MENGYDKELETLFEKESKLFKDAVARIIKRAEQHGYEGSLLVFIKRYPAYEAHPVLQQAFRERASVVGYEKEMSSLASLCPLLFQDIVHGIVAHAKTKGYTHSLRDFIDRHHYENMTETDITFLKTMIDRHQEEMGEILAAQRAKEASLSQAAQHTSFFPPLSRFFFWRSTAHCKDKVPSPCEDERSLLKSS
jgi:hypothetical protein